MINRRITSGDELKQRNGLVGIVKANAPLVTNEVRPQSVRFLFPSCSP